MRDNVHVMPPKNHAPASTSGGLRTRKQAAEYLAISERRLDELTRAGRLLAKRDGNRVFYELAELERHIANLDAYEPAS